MTNSLSVQNNRRFCVFRFLGTIGFAGMFAALVYVGGPMFLQLPLLFYLFALTSLLLLATFRIDYLCFVPSAVASLFSTPARQDFLKAEIAQYGCYYVVASGGALGLISIVQLSQLEDIANMLVYIFYASISMLYAMIGLLFFLLVRKAHLSEPQKGKN